MKVFIFTTILLLSQICSAQIFDPSKHIIAADFIPRLENSKLHEGSNPQPMVPGTQNFRITLFKNIMASAQPSTEGFRSMAAIARKNGYNRVHWINLREETIVFLDGKSYCIRLKDKPNQNLSLLEDQKISTYERLDEQLKIQIQSMLKESSGKLEVHYENAEGNLITEIKSVVRVQTPQDVFDELRKEGLDVEMHRVPIKDMDAPEPRDLQAIYNLVTQIDTDHSAIAMNCHAGMGRTTTGVVTADLAMYKKLHQSIPAINLLIRKENLTYDLLKVVGDKRKALAALDPHSPDYTSATEAFYTAELRLNRIREFYDYITKKNASPEDFYNHFPPGSCPTLLH